MRAWDLDARTLSKVSIVSGSATISFTNRKASCICRGGTQCLQGKKRSTNCELSELARLRILVDQLSELAHVRSCNSVCTPNAKQLQLKKKRHGTHVP